MIRVVIADDEAKVCQLICALVEWDKLNMELAGIAHNGIEALQLIESERPQLLITDIRMPGCDGLELIERAKALNPDLKIVIVSGFRHFEYAQSAMRFGVRDYLLKPIKKTELNDTLEMIATRYHDEQLAEHEHHARIQEERQPSRAAFFEVLSQGASLKGEIETINQTYHFHFEEGDFVLFLIKLDEEDLKATTDSMYLMLESYQHVAQDKLKELCYEQVYFQKESRLYGLLNTEPQNKIELRKQLRDFWQKQVLFTESAPVSMALSRFCSSVQELPTLYSEINDLILERLQSEKTALFEADDDKRIRLSRHIQAWNRELERAIELLDHDLLQESLELLIENWVEQDCKAVERYAAMIQTYTSYLLSLQKHDLFRGNMAEELRNFARFIDRFSSWKSLLSAWKNRIMQRFDEVCLEKQQELRKPVREAKKYMAQHFAGNISLDEVAELVGFSPSYFSTLFKKETGENFNEYLTQLRLEQAKNMLKETKQSIMDICQAVGYNDLKHFTQTFKKHTGLKPNEYRKLYA